MVNSIFLYDKVREATSNSHNQHCFIKKCNLNMTVLMKMPGNKRSGRKRKSYSQLDTSTSSGKSNDILPSQKQAPKKAKSGYK